MSQEKLFTTPEASPDSDYNWRDDALCARTDLEAFFPEKGTSNHDAKKICSNCEVRAECLEYALQNGEQFGVWGGLSERERRKLVGKRTVGAIGRLSSI